MKNLVWVIPLIPFLGAFLNGVVLRGRIPKQTAGWLAVVACGLSCLLSIAVVGAYMGSAEHHEHLPWDLDGYTWIPAGLLQSIGAEGAIANLTIPLGFLVDPLSSIMLLFVTFVGMLIHVYSIGYMAHENGFQRFFTYLNLFMGSMLVLVLGNNYAGDVRGLGGRGAVLLPPDRLLLRPGVPALRRAQGVHRQPYRRLRLHARRARAGVDLRHAEVHGAVLGDRRQPGARRGAVRPRHDRRRLRHPLPVHRRHRQERADAALRLAARRHGGPDPGLRADPRRHHGHRRRLHGGAVERAVPARRRNLGAGRDHRLPHRGAARPPSPSRRPTSRRCSPTRPCRSSATCSWPAASGAYGAGDLPRRSPTPSSRRSSSSARAR